MPYDEDLADRLRLLLAGEGVTEKRMFGGLAFLRQGHLAIAASGSGGILVRVDPDELGRLLAEPGAEPFEMQGRPMKGWLRVDAEALDDDAVLRTWADRGLAYVRSLPPKEEPSAGRQAGGRASASKRERRPGHPDRDRGEPS